MRWKKFCGICLLAVLVCLSVSALAVSQVTVTMTKEEAAQYRLQKISAEFQTIVAELRKANPKQYERLDTLQKEAEGITKELQGKAAPAPKTPAKK